MNSSTMLILGIVLVLILPISLMGYFSTNNPTLLFTSMLGVITFPVGAVMLAVGIMKINKKK